MTTAAISEIAASQAYQLHPVWIPNSPTLQGFAMSAQGVALVNARYGL